jgi:hypothetical protein
MLKDEPKLLENICKWTEVLELLSPTRQVYESGLFTSVAVIRIALQGGANAEG